MESFSPSISFLLDGVFERTQGIKVPFERVKSDFCIDVSLSTIIIISIIQALVATTNILYKLKYHTQ